MFSKDKLLEITEGWLNVIKNDTPEIKAMAIHRRDICLQCEFVKGGVLFKIKCGKCGCPILAKSRSKHSKCPLKKWKI